MATPAQHAHRGGEESEAPAGELTHSGNGRSAAPSARARKASTLPNPATLAHELRTCITESDIVQVLYRGLASMFGYDSVSLHVLEREGWYHRLVVDTGVLQDLRRRPVADSYFAHLYKQPHPKTTVMPVVREMRPVRAKGPGAGRVTRLSIWVPIEHQGRVVASAIYQSHKSRRVSPDETAYLDEVHRQLGVLVVNASLNELTRNQARRLEALNHIGRAIASSLDEASILTALHLTLSELLPVDELKMLGLQDDRPDRARMLEVRPDSAPASKQVAMRSVQAAPARTVISTGQALVTYEPESALWVPIKEGGAVRGALGITSKRPYAYEESTAAFLELVAD
ncbi:MAG: hypothetical protein E6I75_28160, partial [Chloroflexi bacterium]